MGGNPEKKNIKNYYETAIRFFTVLIWVIFPLECILIVFNFILQLQNGTYS